MGADKKKAASGGGGSGGGATAAKKPREQKKDVQYIKIDLTDRMREQFGRVEAFIEERDGYGLSRAQIAGKAIRDFLDENDPESGAHTGEGGPLKTGEKS